MKFTVNVNDSETIANFFRAYAESGTPSAALARIIAAYESYNAYRADCGASASELRTTADIIARIRALRDEVTVVELRYLDDADAIVGTND